MRNIEKIFENTSCISTEMLEAYAKNELSADEKYAVEKHIVECDMCTDVLEGYAEMKQPEKLLFYTQKLNKKIDYQIKPKSIIFRMKPILSIAAALIVLFGIGYFIKISVFDLSGDVAVAEQMTEKNEIEPVVTEKDDIYINKSIEQQEMIDVEAKKKEINNSEEQVEVVIEEKEAVISDGLAGNEEVAAETIGLEKELIEDEETDNETFDQMANSGNDDELSETDFNMSKVHANIKSGSTVSDNDKQVSAEESAKKTVFAGATRSNGVRRLSAKNKKEEKSSDLDKIYELAVELYNNKKYGHALQKLNKLIRLNSAHKFDALWYKALIYETQGKPEEAKKIFQKVAESKTVFSKKATIKLEN